MTRVARTRSRRSLRAGVDYVDYAVVGFAGPIWRRTTGPLLPVELRLATAAACSTERARGLNEPCWRADVQPNIDITRVHSI
jgi:hypothetical protein